jgi:hypothetical protein
MSAPLLPRPPGRPCRRRGDEVGNTRLTAAATAPWRTPSAEATAGQPPAPWRTAPQAPRPAKPWADAKPGRVGPSWLAWASSQAAPPIAPMTRTLPTSTTRQPAMAAARRSHSSGSRRPRPGSAHSSTADRAIPPESPGTPARRQHVRRAARAQPAWCAWFELACCWPFDLVDGQVVEIDGIV